MLVITNYVGLTQGFMDRREVDRRWVAYLKAAEAVKDYVAEHNKQLLALHTEAARLETLYIQARQQLHAEQDARGR